MGGIGSGRIRGQKPKRLANHFDRLNIRQLTARGVIVKGKTFELDAWDEQHGNFYIGFDNDLLTLFFRGQTYRTEICYTKPHYGGHCAWFRCDCGERVAILYRTHVLSCRHCRDLSYQSQRRPRYRRQLDRATKIRRRLGKQGFDGDEANWTKPKHMHWKTFERLKEQHRAFHTAGFWTSFAKVFR